MPTLEEVKDQIKKLDSLSAFLGRKEIKELPNILNEKENIENILQGTYNNGNGILVATSQRLIFIDKGLFFGLKVEDFAYDKIGSVQYETGLLLGKLTIFVSGNKAIIDNIEKKQTRLFGDWLRNRLNTYQDSKSEKPTPTPQASNGDDDIISKLERLAKLKEQGILTEEEFTAQKNKILGL